MNDKIANLMTSLDVTRKGAERIADILKVGVAILLDEGFSSLTKRRIAKRLGISHGNVNYYFPTRLRMMSCPAHRMSQIILAMPGP